MVEQTRDTRQSTCRRHVESAEHWLRTIVHVELSKVHGPHYITQGAWKKKLKEYVQSQSASAPSKFPREVDATTFDQLIDLACHQDAWPLLKAGLGAAYPLGAREAERFLKHLRDIRNDVAHGRPCSDRAVEQAVCYSNDLIESVKAYFRTLNMNREFNVPAFVEVVDNLGNSAKLPASEQSYRDVNFSRSDFKRLYPGDVLVVEVEVDPSFSPEEYDVEWRLKTSPGGSGTGTTARIEIGISHVSQRMELQFKLRTKNEWHRNSGGYDDGFDIYYRVLPPPC